ncbi:MAG: hypothetical protein FWC12_11680 [Treponema sp.]|nr:hypothetical protein [Treponema sp.]
MKNVLRKLGSVKVWIALWSMIIVSYIVLKDMTGFNNLAMLAMAPIITYLGVNVWGDKIHLDKTTAANKPEGQGDEK